MPWLELGRKKTTLGWPWKQLLFDDPATLLGIGDRVAMSFLAGWWFHALVSLCSQDEKPARGNGTRECFLIGSRSTRAIAQAETREVPASPVIRMSRSASLS